MRVVDLATNIWLNLGEPTDTSIPAVSYWIRGRIGWLNTMLYEDFYLSDGLEILNSDGSEISPMVGSILISLYDIYRNDVDIRSSMNALAANPITSVTDNLGGVSFTRQNRNEQAKTYVSLRKDNMLLLNQLIQAYRSRSCQPSAVAGDDTLASEWGNIYTYRPFTTRVGPY